MKVRTRKLMLTKMILANSKAKTIRIPLRTDPTRTTGMREHFCRFVDRQFDKLKADVLRAVGTEDWLGVGQVENAGPEGEARDRFGRWVGGQTFTLSKAIELYGPVLAKTTHEDGYTLRVHARDVPTRGRVYDGKQGFKGRGGITIQSPEGDVSYQGKWMDIAEDHYPEGSDKLSPVKRARLELEEQKKYGCREMFLVEKHWKEIEAAVNELSPHEFRVYKKLYKDPRELYTYDFYRDLLKLMGPKIGITANLYRPFVCNGEVGYFPSRGLIEVPDVRQPDNRSCGAAAAMSVGMHFGVGPDSVEQWAADLGTSEEGTHPQQIVEYLRSLGLQVEAFQHGNLSTLDGYLDRGWPVLCCVQDYGPKKSWEHGHYLVVLGRKEGYLFAQDPAMDNVMVDGHSKPVSELGSLHKPGRVMIPEEEFLQAWHDESEDGTPFVRFGIAVGPRADSSNEERQLTAGATPARPTHNTRWAFATSSGKLAAFGRWLRTRVADLITGRSMREVWRKYVEAGWKKGAARAFDDTHQRQKWESHPDTVGTDLYRGGREEFLRSSFNHPESVEKVKLLASRTFTDLDGVTAAMSTKMTRTLADGLTMGQHPHQIAASLARDVDGIGRRRAILIARTELIRAHSEGTLDNLERLGVEEVGVAVEWTTANDNKVCPKCEALQGIVLKTHEAHGLIPLHPECRCAFIPSFDPPSSPEEVEAAVQESGIEPEPRIGRTK